MSTWEDAVDKLSVQQVANFAVIGNSVGCGYNAAGYTNIPGISLSNGKLTTAGKISDVVTGAWVTRFRAFVKSYNAGSQVYNFSGNGWDSNDHRGISLPSSGVVGPTDTVAEILAMSTKPDLVLLPLQINDPNHGLTLATFETNTRAIIAGLAAGGVPCLIMLENWTSIANYVDFQTRAVQISNSLNLPFIDGRKPFGPNGDGRMFDYAHPNDTGHAAEYQAVAGWFLSKMHGGRALAAGRSDARGVYKPTGALRIKRPNGTIDGFPVRPGSVGDPIRIKLPDGVHGVQFQ